MNKMEDNSIKEFWDNKYLKENIIWGFNPTKIIIDCENIFYENNIRDILIMGIGYGRNGKYFTEKGYNVDGVEISDEAINIGRSFVAQINFIKGNVLDIELQKKYNAVFCYDILQILLKNDRNKLIEQCIKYCKNDGLIMISCLSKKDGLFGMGKEIEENTFKPEDEKELHFHYSDEFEMKNINSSLEAIKIEHFKEHYDGGITKDRIYGIYRKR
jgi:2-polyprenyl-3-methyl-5-hydroxy-6-metoxy-1,4-benzoquinol methylase